MKYAIGIDLGATTAKTGIITDTGKIVDYSLMASNTTDDEHLFINSLSDTITALCRKSNIDRGSIVGIGVGIPKGNFFGGTVEYAQNLTWGRDKVIPFANLLSRSTGIKCLLTNDANAAALGEMQFGVARGMSNFIEITLGTGVGAGVVVDGRLIYGANSMAGELGHCTVRPPDGESRVCTCGRRNCLETYCSATGVALSGRLQALNTYSQTTLKHYKPEDITAKIVYEEALKGDIVSMDIYREAGRLLGEAFAEFAVVFSPEAIVIFGGMAKAKDMFLPSLIDSFGQNFTEAYRLVPKILFSSLPEADAAILGAGSLVLI